MNDEQLKNRIDSLENKVRELEAWKESKTRRQISFPLDRDSLMEVDDKLFFFGKISGTGDTVIIDAPAGSSPSNIVLTSFPCISYIRISDDETKNEIVFNVTDSGTTINYVVILTSQLRFQS